MSSGKRTLGRPQPRNARTAGPGRVEPLESRLLLAAAPVPLGPEFPLHTFTTLDQSRPAVAADGAGRFVAAWDSPGRDQNERGVVARVFEADGSPAGAEFVVNSYTHSHQFRPAVAASPTGFVVVWVSDVQDGDRTGIFGQLYAPDGTPRGAEFAVNEAWVGIQTDPAVAMAADGRFVVTWADAPNDGGPRIRTRLFDADGLPRGNSFPVNTALISMQSAPAAGMAADGGFVLCWQSVDADTAAYTVYARLFGADGAATGDAFVVTADEVPQVRDPAVAVEPGGAFTIAWQTDPGDDEAGDRTDGGDGSGSGIFARRYGPDGVPRGDEFRVNAQTVGDQVTPAVSADADGSLVFAWHGAGDGDGFGVFARRFDAQGQASEELPVNTHTPGDQWAATAAAGPDGRFLVAWRSAEQDGSGDGVYARVFAGELPEEPPSVGVSDASATEAGPGATTEAVFTVTLSGARTYPVSVRYATRAGTAGAPADYADAAGTLTFAPGETGKTVSVAVAGDALDEPEETFTLDLSDPVGATLGAASATGRIADDDPLPLMTISDAARGEGDDGDTDPLEFEVTLSEPSGRTILVAYRLGIGTADTATRGEDFDATPHIVTFAPGETRKTISVPILGDAVYEGEETFSVLLGYVEAPTFTFPDDGAAVGTIREDDVPPTLLRPEVVVTEDDDPAGRLVDVPLALSAAAAVPVTVRYATADENAAAGADYEPTSGTVTFAPGQTSKVIQVRVFGDDAEEATEGFLVRFSDAQNVIAEEDGRVVILDDDVRRAAVTGVFVGGSAWSPAFRQHLADTGAGSAQFGFLIADGAAQLDELPWTNVDRVSVRFNRDVLARQSNLTVRGAGGAEYLSTLIERDDDTFTYTWTFARPFPKDRLVLLLNGTRADGVRDVSSGESLDGEWANGADAYPSGDGAAGGDFVFAVNVLPGDATRDGKVDAADLADVRARQTTRVSRRGSEPWSYSVFHDVTANGAIDVLDYFAVRARQQTALPEPLPGGAITPVAASRSRGAPVRRALFGELPVLG